jgi:cyanobactin maturation PatA/PatG family protease
VVLPGLDLLWGITLGDRRVRVAVLDGPVDQTHPSFAGADLIHVETVVPARPGDGPALRHGTHVASVILGQHASGPVQGLAPRCRGLIVPIFADGPDGTLRHCSQIDLARAILLAVEHGAHVVNVSAGQFSPTGTAHPLLAGAVRTCAERGGLIVSAAGNDGCACLHVPGALPSVLAVGAMSGAGEPLAFSNWGRPYRTQGILAPGEHVRGAVPGGGVAAYTGTSTACAIVSGVAALLLSLQLRHGRSLDARAVRDAILAGAVGCDQKPYPDCHRVLAGRLDLLGALARLTLGELDMPEVTPGPPSPDVGLSPSNVSETGGAAMAAAAAGAAAAPALPSEPAAGGLQPSACACAGGGGDKAGGNASPQRVFAIGTLAHDFGTNTRRESFLAHMQHSGIKGMPEDPTPLLAYLDKNPWEAPSVTWTLNLNETPVYAIAPEGPYADHVYKMILQFVREQHAENVERVSVAGVLVGSVRLLTLYGAAVPVIRPNPRGMYNWTTKALIESIIGKAPAREAPEEERAEYQRKTRPVRAVLDRVYFDNRFQNLGLAPQERALNYAVTNAFMVEQAAQSAMKDGMELDTIAVERSNICRPDSDCWDVQLFFYHPKKQLEQARSVYQFTVDVSDEVPVLVGPMRTWSSR